MKIPRLALVALCGLSVVSAPLRAQFAPRTLDLIQEISDDGAVAMKVKLAFDAADWKPWRTQVGDEPARLRGLMRHQFAAYVIDDFKLEKDDLNRMAVVTLHSPAGPDLLSDGRFKMPIEPDFRLVSHAGRDWFFSGKNPLAGNTLNTLKLVVPPHATGVTIENEGGSNQGVVYAVTAPPGLARRWLVLGLGCMGAGAAAWLGGHFGGRRAARPAPLPASGSV